MIKNAENWLIKLTTKTETVEIKDFGKPGDEIRVEFTNDKGEKRMHVLRVTANGKLVNN